VTQERRKHGDRMHLHYVLQNEFWCSLLSVDFRTNGKNERKKCCILQGMNVISEEYKFAKKSKCLQPPTSVLKCIFLLTSSIVLNSHYLRVNRNKFYTPTLLFPNDFKGVFYKSHRVNRLQHLP
jgi:hypothetical protein